jgi:methylthioribose-1-phosphate isomerase
MYVAHEQGRAFRVYADETRPLLQGARLTAFELAASGIDVTVICDGAAASLMRSGRIQLAVTGADRIAANGDAANKIGTYGVALAARHHGIPFYVAAPRSTFDLELPDGSAIPIEERPEDEVRRVREAEIAAPGARCFNPAFDVTPAELISGIVTEFGVVEPVSAANIRQVLGRGGCGGP